MDATILGIETSCDETAAAVVRNGTAVLSDIVLSQIGDHAAFGGVVPEVASRKHLEAIVPVVSEALNIAGLRTMPIASEALKKAGVQTGGVDAVAATYGPGLIGALLVGLSFAKALALALGVPFIGVNHVEAHILAASLCEDPPEPPFTALVASGGHSSVYCVESYRSFRQVGRTRDDAAGEAFDKAARAAGLGYPGGRMLEAAAAGGDSRAVRFPRSAFKDGTFDFSFSGVKTAAVNYLRREQAQAGPLDCDNPNKFYKDFFASYQAAIVDALAANTISAEKALNTGKIVVTGGVAANRALRERFLSDAEVAGGKIRLFAPPPRLCTDNAAMVAARAYHDYAAGAFSPLTLDASS